MNAIPAVLSVSHSIGLCILIGVIILCLEILYHRKKDEHDVKNARRKFWEKETEANSVRRKDITFLNYIDIPLESLPFIRTDDEELNEYQDTVKNLAGKRILNLSGISNTDLKLEYGAANLPELMQYDDNYNTLTSTLAKWGSHLASIGMSDRAIMVLEYSIDIGSDVSLAYYTLADEYRKKGLASNIDALIEKAGKLDSIMRKPILEKLTTIRSYLD